MPGLININQFDGKNTLPGVLKYSRIISNEISGLTFDKISHQNGILILVIAISDMPNNIFF